MVTEKASPLLKHELVDAIVRLEQGGSRSQLDALTIGELLERLSGLIAQGKVPSDGSGALKQQLTDEIMRLDPEKERSTLARHPLARLMANVIFLRAVEVREDEGTGSPSDKTQADDTAMIGYQEGRSKFVELIQGQ